MKTLTIVAATCTLIGVGALGFVQFKRWSEPDLETELRLARELGIPTTAEELRKTFPEAPVEKNAAP